MRVNVSKYRLGTDSMLKSVAYSCVCAIFRSRPEFSDCKNGWETCDRSSLQNKSAKTNVPGRLTALSYKPKLESESKCFSLLFQVL